MKKSDISELEVFLLESLRKPDGGDWQYYTGARAMADIIGVLVDLKPAATIVFSEDELSHINIIRFFDYLKKHGLCYLEYISHDLRARWRRDNDYFESGITHYYHLFIAKDKETVRKAYSASKKLDRMGELLSDEEYDKVIRDFGKILGYPETAIDCYVSFKKGELEGEELCWEYYLHNPKHLDAEKEMYDSKLNKAILEFAPRTAKVLEKI